MKSSNFVSKITFGICCLIMVLMLGLAGCSGDTAIDIVKKGYLPEAPSKSVGEVFADSFSSPSWKAGGYKDGYTFVVNFSGKMFADGKPNVKVDICFDVNMKYRDFELTQCKVDGAQLSNQDEKKLLKEIYSD